MESLVGDSLIGKKGQVKTSDVKNNVVGLYFSAHWCPPCRNFTPKLVSFYEKMKSLEKDFEIIFVSSDRDENSFEEYYDSMPWLSLPYNDRALKEKLSQKFKIRGIPTLIFVNGETGQVITDSARDIVMSDPEGEKYPWTPPTITEALGDSFVKDGKTISMDTLNGKYIALLFTASWCGPCRSFEPTLKKCYEATQDQDWEIIAVSWDRSEQEYNDYFGEMPWGKLPFGDGRKDDLGTLFKVEGIPTMIMLDKERNVLNGGLRNYISEDPEGKDFPWEPKPVLTLQQGVADINDTPSVLILMEDEADGTKDQFQSIISIIAEKHKEKVKAKTAEPMLFLISNQKGDPISPQIRKLCGLTGESKDVRTLCNGDMCMKLNGSTNLVILDIPDQGGFYTLEGEMTKENIIKFVDDYNAGDLKSSRKQLQRG